MVFRTIKWLVLACFLPGAVEAQQVPYNAEPEKQVHWAMAAFFGTGWYQIDENRSMYIFRIPPRQTVRKAGWDEEGNRKLGIEIQYPIALGLHRLDDIPDFIDFENYGTITFTPGVQVEVPINRRWSLRPYAHFGFGYENDSGEYARIWYGGVKSRYMLDERKRWALLSGVYFAGYKPEYESRGSYGSVMAGFEFDHKLADIRLGDDPLYLNWHLTYNYLFDDLQFHIDEERVATIDDTWELGVALGKGHRKIKIWMFSFEHIGLAFKSSTNGDYKAITVNFRSPFTY